MIVCHFWGVKRSTFHHDSSEPKNVTITHYMASTGGYFWVWDVVKCKAIDKEVGRLSCFELESSFGVLEIWDPNIFWVAYGCRASPHMTTNTEVWLLFLLLPPLCGTIGFLQIILVAPFPKELTFFVKWKHKICSHWKFANHGGFLGNHIVEPLQATSLESG